MMKSWAALKPCHNKRSKSSRLGQANDDPFSELPNDILLSVISSFTMKEAARLSLVSHQWELIWRCVPLLIFEDSRAMEMINKSWEAIPEERPGFVRWVDRVLEHHSGAVIDELRITFDLDQNWQAHVDNWTAVALDKQVKRLELDFSSYWRSFNASFNGVVKRIGGEPLDLPPKFASINSSITRLCLKYVNATDEFIDHLPRSCPLLENLGIVGSKCLTEVSGSFKQVKHLDVSRCDNLKMIDISAPKLCSFVHYNKPVELLHIADASSLVDVSVGTLGKPHNVAYLFDFLSENFSQLVYLNLRIFVSNMLFLGVAEPRQVNVGVENPRALPNLQHLELQVGGSFKFRLGGCTPLIAASPNLQKLTLKLSVCTDKGARPARKWVGFPLKCLKTLEIVGCVGQPIDIEPVLFVFENACVLEEVILDIRGLLTQEQYDSVRERLVMLHTNLPQGVKLIIK